MRNILIPALFLSVLISSNCSSIQEVSSQKGKSVILASNSAKCKVYDSFSRWKILYGTFPLYIPDSTKLFPKSDRSYRIKESSNWSDVIISVLLGFSTTVSKDTLVVEECPLSGNIEKNIAKNLDSDNDTFKRMVGESVEKYLAEKELEYQEALDATLSQNEDKLEIRKDLPTIWLRNGKIIQGKILNQDESQIEIEDLEGNRKTFQKNKILRIKER